MNEEIYEGTPSQEDVLIGMDSGNYNRYRRPDGSTYVHYPYNRMATVTAYSAKDGKGQPIRTTEGKLITGNTQAEANRKRFRYDQNHWVEANRRNTAHLPEGWRNKYTLSEGKNALTMTPFVGDVLDLGNVYTDFNKGNYGMAATGLGLLALPNFIEKPLKTIGRPIMKSFFKNYIIYKPKIDQAEADIATFLRALPYENPIKAVKRHKLYRDRWQSPKIDVGTYNYQGPANSQKDAVDLLNSRILHGDLGVKKIGDRIIKTTEQNLNSKVQLDYVPYGLTSELIGTKNIKHVLPEYFRVNTTPAMAFNGKYSYVNPNINKYLKTTRSDVVKAHEKHHSMTKPSDYPSIEIFDTRHLPESQSEYLNSNELAARGSQLKNYFGFDKSDQKLTGDMLKYAAEHYKDDVFDNNMQQMFSSIVDWDAAAEWFNKNSYKQGGKLIKKQNN